MSSPSPAVAETAEAAAIVPDDAARALVMRQLQMLGEVAEQGLEVGRAIERQARAAQPGDGADLGALAMAHARVARAVRMTVMLQSRLVETLRERQAAEATRKAAARGSAARLIGEVIDDERGDANGDDRAGDRERAERLRAEAAERLEREDFSDLLQRPFGEVVAGVCRDLGLSPDWLSLAKDCAVAEAALNAGPGRAPPEPEDDGPIEVRWLGEDSS